MTSILLLALALAMDCFTVSIVCGVISGRKDIPTMLRLAFLCGLFQAAMPLGGWLLTSRFSSAVEAVDHWIAFGMLAIIGGKMIVESFRPEEIPAVDPRKFRDRLALAFATSIDAFAVGISFACSGYGTISSLAFPLAAIGVVSFVMSVAGFIAGSSARKTISGRIKPELLGGIILIGIGAKILFEHLGA